jgi:hypothetical protein
MSKVTAHLAHETSKDRVAPTQDWFLRRSTWNDPCWVLAPTSALEEERPVLLRWDFKLSGAGFPPLRTRRFPGWGTTRFPEFRTT